MESKTFRCPGDPQGDCCVHPLTRPVLTKDYIQARENEIGREAAWLEWLHDELPRDGEYAMCCHCAGVVLGIPLDLANDSDGMISVAGADKPIPVQRFAYAEDLPFRAVSINEIASPGFPHEVLIRILEELQGKITMDARARLMTQAICESLAGALQRGEITVDVNPQPAAKGLIN